jgi:hypothetical protein
MSSPVQEAGGLREAEALGPQGPAEAIALLHNPRAILDRVVPNRSKIVPNSELHTSNLLQEDLCEGWLEA